MQKLSIQRNINITAPKKSLQNKYRNEITAYKILIIPLIIWGVFFVFAFLRAFFISFTDWNIFGQGNFVGLDNYIQAIFDSDLLVAFKNTLIWTLFMVVGNNVIGLLVAYMVITLKKGESFFRAALFWPTLVSAVIGAQMQLYIFNSSPYGLANTVLKIFGAEPKAWFADPNLALPTLIIFPFILGFGTKMLIYMAGLKQIPTSYYEAAKLETDSEWKVFFGITIPLLKPIIMLNLILSVIEGFKIIAPMQLITGGGPINKTNSVVLSLYQNGFVEYKMGFASAIAFILFTIILIFTVLQLKLGGEEVNYE